MQKIFLSQMGAPFDEFLISDIGKMDITRYKLVIFLCAWKLNIHQRKIIEKKFKNNKRTLVWSYADGFYNEKGCSLKNISSLTGIKISAEYKESLVRIFPFSGKSSLPKFLPGGINFEFGIGHLHYPWGPIFYSEDKKAETLGCLTSRKLGSNDLILDKAGWVEKDFGNWKSVYFAIPGIPSIILRKLALQAGVHIYNHRDDILYANKNFVSVFAHERIREIKLPKKYDVREVFSGREIGKKLNSFTDLFKEGKQKLYRLTIPALK